MDVEDKDDEDAPLNCSENNVGYIPEEAFSVSDEVKEQWEWEQMEMKKRWYPHDCEAVSLVIGRRSDDLEDADCYIGGVDISYIKGDNVNACAALVVIRLRDLELVYEDYEMVKITAPYIPGFLAFRESEFLVALFEKLKISQPEHYPHITMVDGNGYLHVREFGLACQIGVLLDMATIGVAKNLYQIDGLEKNDAHKQKISELTKSGDRFPLVGRSGKTYGYALKSSDWSTNPIYVSVGHMIDLQSATEIVHRCCRHRIPEPVRQADINSREYIRVHHPS